MQNTCYHVKKLDVLECTLMSPSASHDG